MNNVFLLLGSNLGDRQLLLQTAIAQISERVGAVLQTSALYETQAWGKTGEPDYLNQVVFLKTGLTAINVLNEILAIETGMGRKRYEKWGSRLIDIDILFYNDEIIKQDALEIPHPELQNRRFTLEPLAEIAPGLVHPVLNKTMLELKNQLTDSLVVKKL
ncbi:2-amino-4-hydroxy-6-hydroxymethyldihydropteridine diphosphokinase [Mucilaginibacter calamicampi]|uniref:2-amino-4-hydroxy-6-hydroxymethyldihydropteridine pyrophosphokinase n=1 Tax=Mucilaginibacter calamicampi TaxID=1302352 RepID=A0ABW2YW24_9SPHI